jgi:hypothetical protein
MGNLKIQIGSRADSLNGTNKKSGDRKPHKNREYSENP